MSRFAALVLAVLLLGGCETLICPDDDPRPSGPYDFGFCD